MTSAEGPSPFSRHRTGLSPGAKRLIPALLVVLAGVSAHRYCSEPERPVVSFEGAIMGTTWSVKVASRQIGREEQQTIAKHSAERLRRIDRLMSTWKEDSELSRFNRHPGGTPFPVSLETLAVFRVADEVSALSGGAFDITVGPLVAAWGFGAGAGDSVPPAPGEIEALRRRVGYRMIHIDLDSGTLTKAEDGVLCDLSAVAKGFAVDEVARALADLGQDNFLVEVGGELRAKGVHLDGSPWRVAVESPDVAGRSIHRIIELHDLAMATSGDYRDYYETDGRRISHTLDPRTGHPISHSLASVTVLYEDAARADALATALNVLGPEDGYHLAMEHDIAAYFIVRTKDGSFESRSTRRFEDLATGGR